MYVLEYLHLVYTKFQVPYLLDANYTFHLHIYFIGFWYHDGSMEFSCIFAIQEQHFDCSRGDVVLCGYAFFFLNSNCHFFCNYFALLMGLITLRLLTPGCHFRLPTRTKKARTLMWWMLLSLIWSCRCDITSLYCKCEYTWVNMCYTRCNFVSFQTTKRGTHNSGICLERKTCLPLGGYRWVCLLSYYLLTGCVYFFVKNVSHMRIQKEV